MNTKLANLKKMMNFNGIEVQANRSINVDDRMITLCKPYVEKYDLVSEAFDKISADDQNAAELLVEGLHKLDVAWAQVAASWALATTEINPSLRKDLKRIIAGGACYHIDFIRGHIEDAMAYLCDEDGKLLDEDVIRGAIEAQRAYEATEGAA